jgi:hypothetical protein
VKRTAAAEATYRLFFERPDDGESSYLHDSYRRGLAGLRAPPRSHVLQRAAWEAGRDRRRAGKG